MRVTRQHAAIGTPTDKDHFEEFPYFLGLFTLPPKKRPWKEDCDRPNAACRAVFVSEQRAVFGHFTKRGFHQDGVCP